MQSTQLADNQLYRSWQISVLSRESRRSVAVGVSLFQYSPQDCALIALHCLALGERPTIASTNIHPTTTTPECEQPPAYSRVSPVLLHAIISYTRFDPTYAEGDLRGK